ncbi:ATP-dependent helicase, partial [Streptomyces sp. 2MCAF27]
MRTAWKTMGRKSVARVVVREPRTGTRIAPPLATPEAVAFATALLEGGWAAVFLPGEPARLGRLLLWNPAGMVARDVTAPTSVAHESAELVLPHGRSVRRRRVDGYALPVGVAVAALAGVRPLHPSAIAWQAAARLALRLLADGRIHPTLTDVGYDSWQAGPLTAAQRQTLDALAAAFPPHAHCLPEPGPAPLRIAEPAALVSQFCDALADELVRT